MSSCQYDCWLAKWLSYTISKGIFFIVNENITLTDLGKERQKSYWIRKIGPQLVSCSFSQLFDMIDYEWWKKQKKLVDLCENDKQTVTICHIKLL